MAWYCCVSNKCNIWVGRVTVMVVTIILSLLLISWFLFVVCFFIVTIFDLIDKEYDGTTASFDYVSFLFCSFGVCLIYVPSLIYIIHLMRILNHVVV